MCCSTEPYGLPTKDDKEYAVDYNLALDELFTAKLYSVASGELTRTYVVGVLNLNATQETTATAARPPQYYIQATYQLFDDDEEMTSGAQSKSDEQANQQLEECQANEQELNAGVEGYEGQGEGDVQLLEDMCPTNCGANATDCRHVSTSTGKNDGFLCTCIESRWGV